MKVIPVVLAVTTLVSSSFLFASPAEANYKQRVNHRQRHQQQRLWQGTKNGSLTYREYANAQKTQAKIARKEARYRVSGDGITKKEAAKLEAMQDLSSKKIYNQKHDQQTQNQ